MQSWFLDLLTTEVGRLPVWEFVLLRLLPISLVVSVVGAFLWERVISKPRLTFSPSASNPVGKWFKFQENAPGAPIVTTNGSVLQIDVRNRSLKLPWFPKECTWSLQRIVRVSSSLQLPRRIALACPHARQMGRIESAGNFFGESWIGFCASIDASGTRYQAR